MCTVTKVEAPRSKTQVIGPLPGKGSGPVHTVARGFVHPHPDLRVSTNTFIQEAKPEIRERSHPEFGSGYPLRSLLYGRGRKGRERKEKDLQPLETKFCTEGGGNRVVER